MNVKWELTPASFERLLMALDSDRDRAAVGYENLRLKLIRFFELRGCQSSEVYADHVMDRLARRIDAGERIENVYSYCYGIARKFLLEVQRQSARESDALKSLTQSQNGGLGVEEAADARKLLAQCMAQLPTESRDLLLAYYQLDKQAGIDRRKELANRLGIPLNALRLRAHRIRARLQECVERHRSTGAATLR